MICSTAPAIATFLNGGEKINHVQKVDSNLCIPVKLYRCNPANHHSLPSCRQIELLRGLPIGIFVS